MWVRWEAVWAVTSGGATGRRAPAPSSMPPTWTRC